MMAVTFKIEPIQKYLAGYKPQPNRPHSLYEHHEKGFLVTGYADGSDWLVSPLGRAIRGRMFPHAPNNGWAIADDRRDYHRLHLYILDFPSKTHRKVEDLPLSREFDIVAYDSERLIAFCPPASNRRGVVRELAVIDIATARVSDRFTLKGLTHVFNWAFAVTPDGWIKRTASRLDEANERLYIQGVISVHPLTREIAFETFQPEGHAPFTISPSGRYVLTAAKTRPAARDSLFEQSVEVWTGSPLSHWRNLPLRWVNTASEWKVPTHVYDSEGILWQDDETAFWWGAEKSWVCVGMDGRTSPPTMLGSHGARFKAQPERHAELIFERPEGREIYALDGSPSQDLSVPRQTPAAIMQALDAAETKRQKAAQTALTKIVKAKNELRFAAKSSQASDIIETIDAITTALDRGLAWFADDEGIVTLTVKIDGISYDETRFFALAEKLGHAAVPALTGLLAKCRLDADFPHIWCGELEDGQQAFGTAAKALAGIDASAWPQLADHEKCIDDFHEQYFRGTVVPHFVKSHGWCEESFDFSLADIVQVRGNFGTDYTYAWRRSGLAAAAEKTFAPAAFAARMLRVRDLMLASPIGTFAKLAATAAAGPAPMYGWANYDSLFGQIKASLTPWEASLFEELKQQSQS